MKKKSVVCILMILIMPTLLNGQTFLERLNKKVKEKVNVDIPNTQAIVGLKFYIYLHKAHL